METMIQKLTNAGYEIIDSHMHGTIVKNNNRHFAVKHTNGNVETVYRTFLNGDWQLLPGGKQVKTINAAIKFINERSM